MADEKLKWYIENPIYDGHSQGATYCLDRSYALPGVVRICTGISPQSDVLEIDIKSKLVHEDTWVSMFTNLPTVSKGEEGIEGWDDFNDSLTLLPQYSFVRLEIPQSGGAKKITVTLELQHEYKEEEVPEGD